MRRSLVLLACPCILAAAAHAQPAAELVSRPAVKTALAALKLAEPETIRDQIALCEIPAPPFGEAKRAERYRALLAEAGLKNVRIDAAGNVIGEHVGAEPGPVLVLAAHLDTVFPAGTEVKVERAGDVLKGPGIGDDCRGLAVNLAVARALAPVATRGSVLVVGDVGEEGLGNLRGVRHLLTDELTSRPAHFVSVDASGYDLVNQEIGSNRYRVTFQGPGGHSYWAFGLPSAIHALGRAIDKVARFKVPARPKTTFTVGRIEGGTSVNAIARSAWMEVDLRSEDAAELARLDGMLRAAVTSALDEENAFWSSEKKLTVEVQPIGTRPVGAQDGRAPIVAATLAVDAALGLDSHVTSGSTDAGFPVSLGIPAIAVGGGGRWVGMHSLEESFDATDSYRGTQRVFLLTLALAGTR